MSDTEPLTRPARTFPFPPPQQYRFGFRDLNDNSLTYLPDDVFQGLGNLKELWVGFEPDVS